jgi:hypothetical protein
MMKSVSVFLVTALLMAFTSHSQAQSQQSPQDSVQGPVLKLFERYHDFGDIKEGDVVEYVFTFENTGNDTLLIEKVVSTCGCTVPEFSNKPILPNEKGTLKVTYNSKEKEGIQNKVITIISNAVNGPIERPIKFSIRVNVLPRD